MATAHSCSGFKPSPTSVGRQKGVNAIHRTIIIGDVTVAFPVANGLESPSELDSKLISTGASHSLGASILAPDTQIKCLIPHPHDEF